MTKSEFTSNVINDFEQIKLIKYKKFVDVVYFEKIQIYVFNYEYLNFFNEIINVVEKKIEIILSKKYRKFVNVFNKQKTNKLSQYDRFDHAIKIKNFFFKFIYNLSMTKLKIFKKYINDNLKKKFIISLSSSIKTFILFVSKSNDDLRFCVNYKNLNVIIKKNRYFFSLIKQLLNRLIKI